MSEKTYWKELLDQSNKNYVAPPAKPKNSDAHKVAEVDRPLALNTWDAVATEFVYVMQDQARYSPERSMWLLWDGHVWKWDTLNAIREKVKEWGRYTLNRPGLENWGKQILSTKGINEILALAKTHPRMAVHAEDFDSGIYELNTPAGVVDLWTGEISPATPNRLMKRSTSVAPDAKCPTPKYDRLMAETFAGEPELSEYMENMLGVSLIKAQDEQVFMYMYGEAGAGKGTIMNIVQKLLGTDDAGYATYVDPSILVQKRNEAHPTELMQLLGARIAITSEITEGQHLDTGKLNRITGGDTIKGRYMGKDYVSFEATHTLWLMANHRLHVPKDAKGVWRRLKTIEFKHSKREGEFIKRLDSIIVEEEGPGVLAKWIARATEYLAHGFHIPDAVVAANDTYKAEQDTVTEWMENCASSDDPEHFTIFEALRDSYMKWCRRESKKAIGSRPFAQELQTRGFASGKQYVTEIDGSKKQVRGYVGIGIS